MALAEPHVTSPESLGARIRALREAMDLSLRDLALRSGVRAPMLSQVERGETSPTLQVATRIAHGLELRLSQLLRLDEGGAVSVVRADERRTGPGAASGHTYEILTAPLPRQRAGAAPRPPAPPADARARQPRERARAGGHRDPPLRRRPSPAGRRRLR